MLISPSAAGPRDRVHRDSESSGEYIATRRRAIPESVPAVEGSRLVG
jgi:hypothetical protein